MKRALRWAGLGLLGLAGLAAVAAGAGWAWLGHTDLAPLLAQRATAALGRDVSAGSVRVQPGRWVRVAVRDARLANTPGGSAPDMARAARLDFEVEAMSLLRGPARLRNVVADGVDVLLERGADRAPNWRFGPARPPSPEPPDRSRLPTVGDARLSGALTYRTSSGKPLVAKLDEGTLRMAEGEPVRLAASGLYNGVPIGLEALGDPPDQLRRNAPYPAKLTLSSGETILGFAGAFTDPLGLDGAQGELTLAAPTAEALLQVAGLDGNGPGLRLAGRFEHQGGLWRLFDAAGSLDAAPVLGLSLELQEGAAGAPDTVAVAARFGTLDLNELLSGQQGGEDTGGANVPLAIDQAPDVLLSGRLQATQVRYGALQLEDARLHASLTPGRVAVEELSLAGWGGRVRAAGRVDALSGNRGDVGGRVTAQVDMNALDVQALRQALGLHAVPIAGRMDGHVAVEARGATLNGAARGARVSAVVTMAGGSIGRQLLELASLDTRTLFRRAQGSTPVSCLLGAVDMRAGVGTVSPLRVRSGAGTVAGSGRFDLYRKRLDLLVASESVTTSNWALDVPVRVSGSFADPDISPARWSAAGRSLLAAGDDPGRLLPSLRAYARRSPCLGRRG